MNNEDISYLTFGEQLNAYRKRKHLTQRRLAAKLGVHYNTICRWEQGDFLPEAKGIIIEVAKQLSLNDSEKRSLLEASLFSLSPYWYIPYQRNPFFTGREDFLQSMHGLLSNSNAIASPRSYALHGLGGIGKTQIAIEYAYRHSQEFSAILWFDGRTEENWISSLRAIAECLRLTETKEQDQQKTTSAVAKWLSNHRNWLLILDDVKEVNTIKQILPGVRQGALLFTTRRQTLGALAQMVEIEPMTPEEGVQFLFRRTKHLKYQIIKEQLSLDEQRAAITLTDVMSGFPLALDQVGAYIEETQCSLSDFLQLFQANPFHVLDIHRSYSDYPLSMISMLTDTFEDLQRINPVAAQLLIICCFLEFDEIPKELITGDMSFLKTLLPSMPFFPFQIHEIFKDLHASALIRRDNQTGIFTIYTLVQIVLKERAPDLFPRIWVEIMLNIVKNMFSNNVRQGSKEAQINVTTDEKVAKTLPKRYG